MASTDTQTSITPEAASKILQDLANKPLPKAIFPVEQHGTEKAAPSPSEYDWKAPATKTGTPNPSDYDWKAPIEQQRKESSSTTLNFNTGPNGVAISDNHGNEFIQRPGGVPAITCNGKAQVINIDKGIDVAMTAVEHLPPEVLAGALKSAAKAGPVPSVSGNVTFEGNSPLTTLCNAGKAAGILQR